LIGFNLNPVKPCKRGENMFLTPIKKYPGYKKYAEKLEKARADFVEKEINFGKTDAIAKRLEISLGIDKPGEKINWAKIQEADQNSKIAKRELELASEQFEKAEENLKNEILNIKKLRRADAETIGKTFVKKALKILKDVEKLRSDYAILHQDIGQDLGKQEKIDFGGEETIIGPDLRYVEWSNRHHDRTRGYLKKVEEFDETAKMYEERKKGIWEEYPPSVRGQD